MELNPFCYSHIYNPDTEASLPSPKLPNTVTLPKLPERDLPVSDQDTRIPPSRSEPLCEGR